MPPEVVPEGELVLVGIGEVGIDELDLVWRSFLARCAIPLRQRFCMRGMLERTRPDLS